MNDRERWTVYPLLILSLGIALRSSGKFGPTKLISCETLMIERPDGTRQMELAALPESNGGGGLLKIVSGDGKSGIELLAVSEGGIVKVIGANGQPQVVLETSQNGGVLVTLSSNGRPLVSAGPTQIGGVVTTFSSQGNGAAILSAPANPTEHRSAEADPADPQPPAMDKPEDANPNAAEPGSPRGEAETKPAGPADESPAPTEKKPAGDTAPREKAIEPG
jgi:hypothetical protein